MSQTDQLALYAALLAAFVLAALRRPATSVAAILCMYGLKQWGQTSSGWLAAHGPFTNYAIGTLVLLALVVQKARGKCVLCNVQPATWTVIGLFSYALLSIVWTPRPDLALDMWASAAPYVTAAVLLAPLTVHDSEDLSKAYSALLFLGGALVVALLFFAKWGDRGVMVNGVASEETNPLAIAMLGGAVASSAMFLRPKRLPALGWTLRLVIVAASLAVIVKSGSRGQLVATMATLVLMLPVAFKVGQIRGLVPILIAVGVIGYATEYAAQSYIRRDDDRWSQQGAIESASDRWKMCAELLSHWGQSPLAIPFGLGNSAAMDPNIANSYPHDIPIEILGEEGVLGIIIYMSINWLAVQGLFRTMRATQGDDESRRLLAVAGANFLFSLITSLKEGNMAGSPEFFMAAILLARMPELVAARSESAPAKTAVAQVPKVSRFANIMQ